MLVLWMSGSTTRRGVVRAAWPLQPEGGGLVNHHLELFGRVDGVGNETDGAADLL